MLGFVGVTSVSSKIGSAVQMMSDSFILVGEPSVGLLFCFIHWREYDIGYIVLCIHCIRREKGSQ